MNAQNASGVPSALDVRWLSSARRSFDATMLHIGAQDQSTAIRVKRRVQSTLALLAAQPGLGTPLSKPNDRRFAIPKTGHFIEYRITGKDLIILRWTRQRRKSQP